jgi:hypothetical protein
MVSRVHQFDVILTETEAEALILEATLVKKHKPKYNGPDASFAITPGISGLFPRPGRPGRSWVS